MKTVTATILTVLFASPAFAYSDAAKYSHLLSQARITLTEAIAKAEKHMSGHAVNAEIDQRMGTVVFEVEVLSANKMYELRIDAKNGNVLNVREDRD